MFPDNNFPAFLITKCLCWTWKDSLVHLCSQFIRLANSTHAELLKPVRFVFCKIIMVIPSMLCFLSFLNISYRFKYVSHVSPSVLFTFWPQMCLRIPSNILNQDYYRNYFSKCNSSTSYYWSMLTVCSKCYLHIIFILTVVNFPKKLTSWKQIRKSHVKHGKTSRIILACDFGMKEVRHEAESMWTTKARRAPGTRARRAPCPRPNSGQRFSICH